MKIMHMKSVQMNDEVMCCVQHIMTAFLSYSTLS